MLNQHRIYSINQILLFFFSLFNFAEGARAGAKAAAITCVVTAVPTVCFTISNSLLFHILSTGIDYNTGAHLYMSERIFY